MKHCLNYSKEDPNYILLEKIFKIIGSRKSRTIIASKGVKNINMMILSIKITFTANFLIQPLNSLFLNLKEIKSCINSSKSMKYPAHFKFQNSSHDSNPIHTLKSQTAY